MAGSAVAAASAPPVSAVAWCGVVAAAGPNAAVVDRSVDRSVEKPRVVVVSPANRAGRWAG
jgi:hypothetical protein